MKKVIGLTMVGILVLVLALVGCNTVKKVETTDVTENGLGGNVEIPNPFIEYKTIDEAVAHVDFEVKLPTNIPEGYKLKYTSVIENELLELVYTKGESKICYRQGRGTEDISGDYNVYNEVSVEKVKDDDVTFSGQNSKINLAVWTDGTYSYSVSINIGEEGIDQDTATSVVEGIK